MFTRTIMTATTAIAMALPVAAHHDEAGFVQAGITVSHVHTVATGDMSHAIDLYMTIENDGEEAVTLTGAHVDFAQDGVFQAPVVGDDGTMSVREISAIEIAPGQSVTLQPGGAHVVFNDVQESFAAGDHFHAGLSFADLGEMEIEVEVERADEALHANPGETG